MENYDNRRSMTIVCVWTFFWTFLRRRTNRSEVPHFFFQRTVSGWVRMKFCSTRICNTFLSSFVGFFFCITFNRGTIISIENFRYFINFEKYFIDAVSFTLVCSSFCYLSRTTEQSTFHPSFLLNNEKFHVNHE